MLLLLRFINEGMTQVCMVYEGVNSCLFFYGTSVPMVSLLQANSCKSGGEKHFVLWTYVHLISEHGYLTRYDIYCLASIHYY